MTHQEKEALLKRIYALPTEWADAGGSYGKGGPVGSDDAAMLWPEAVIDAINQFAEDNNVPVKQPDLEWVKTSDRLPTKADANKESKVLGWIPGYGYRGADYKFVIGRPEHVTWWMPFPSRPEVEE